MIHVRSAVSAAVATLGMFAQPALASWTSDPTQNTPIAVAPESQISLEATRSGTQILSVWEDNRTSAGANHGIYAQAINESGVVQWTVNGVEVVPPGNSVSEPAITPDGSGGVFVTWSSIVNNHDVFAQRVDASGNLLWAPGGVAVSTGTAAQIFPKVTSDGAGGILIVWQDSRNGNSDIYGQRLNSLGESQWTPGGVALAAGSGEQSPDQVVSDGAGGGIVAYASSASGNYDIYAQRFDSAGSTLWAGAGAALDTATGNQLRSQIVADGFGGAIVLWENTALNSGDLYAQRVNSAGSIQWTAGGVPVASVTGVQDGQVLVADGTGGAAMAWQDTRGGGRNLYAQSLSPTGSARWLANGVAVTTGITNLNRVQIQLDTDSNAVLIWDSVESSISHIRAQKLDTVGQAGWTTGGISVSSASGIRSRARVVLATNNDPIIHWQDNRNGNTDIYAQRVITNTGALLPVAMTEFAVE